jgi:crossover junction endodeoxyribonuclease RuvC
MSGAFRLLGIDPGLRRTGWGVVEAAGSRLTHVANGTIASNDKASVPVRLAEIEAALETIMKDQGPPDDLGHRAGERRGGGAEAWPGAGRAAAHCRARRP